MTHPAVTSSDQHKQQATAEDLADGQASQAAAEATAASKAADAEATPLQKDGNGKRRGSHVRFCTPGPEHAIAQPRGSASSGMRTAGVNSSNAGVPACMHIGCCCIRPHLTAAAGSLLDLKCAPCMLPQQWAAVATS